MYNTHTHTHTLTHTHTHTHILVQPNHQLLGPKAFPLDRLMAIFYSILEEDVPPAAHIYSQVCVSV